MVEIGKLPSVGPKHGVRNSSYQTPIGSLAHTGCDPRIAAATAILLEKSASYSMRSRRYPMSKLIATTVDVSWKLYISDLPDSFLGKALCKSWIPSYLIGHLQARTFEDQIIEVVTAVDGKRHVSGRPSIHGTRVNNAGVISVAPVPSDVVDTFKATLSSIRDIAFFCSTKKPAKSATGKLNTRRRRPHCEVCSEPTELVSVLEKGAWPVDDPDERLSLSSRYCPNHRPKLHDGTWNPAYKRAIRTNGSFVALVRQIKHHTANVPDFGLPESKGLGDRFLWFLARRQDLFLDQDERIRELARFLVDYKVKGRKKDVILMLLGEFTQSEVARNLGISRQAVCRIAHSEEFKRVSKMVEQDA